MAKKFKALLACALALTLMLSGTIFAQAAGTGISGATGATKLWDDPYYYGYGWPGNGYGYGYGYGYSSPADADALKAALEGRSGSLYLNKSYTIVGDVTISSWHNISGGSIKIDGTLYIDARVDFSGTKVTADAIVVGNGSTAYFKGCTINADIDDTGVIYFEDVTWNAKLYSVYGYYYNGRICATSTCPAGWYTGFCAGNDSSYLRPYYGYAGLYPADPSFSMGCLNNYGFYVAYMVSGNIYVVSSVIPGAPAAPNAPVPTVAPAANASAVLSQLKLSAKINAKVSSNWSLSGTTITATSSASKMLNRIAIPVSTVQAMPGAGVKDLVFSTPNGVALLSASAINSAIKATGINLTGYLLEVDVIKYDSSDATVGPAYKALGSSALAQPTKLIVRLYNPTSGMMYTLNPSDTLLGVYSGLSSAPASLASAYYKDGAFYYTGDKVQFKSGTVYMPALSGRVLVPVK